jgi:hypothetical protein
VFKLGRHRSLFASHDGSNGSRSKGAPMGTRVQCAGPLNGSDSSISIYILLPATGGVILKSTRPLAPITHSPRGVRVAGLEPSGRTMRRVSTCCRPLGDTPTFRGNSSSDTGPLLRSIRNSLPVQCQHKADAPACASLPSVVTPVRAKLGRDLPALRCYCGARCRNSLTSYPPACTITLHAFDVKTIPSRVRLRISPI